MGVICEQGTFTMPSTASSKTVTFSDVNLKPQILLLYSTTPGTENTIETDMIACIGWALSSTSEHAVSTFSENGVGTSNTRRAHSDANTYYEVDGASTLINAADFTSFADGNGTTAGNFILNWGTVDGNEAAVRYLVIGGDQTSDDITNLKIGNFTAQTSTGVQEITGVGFQPTVVLLLTSANDNQTFISPPENAGEACLSFSAFDNGLARKAMSGASEEAVGTMNTLSNSVGGAAYSSFAVKSGSPGESAAANFVTMTSDGFKLDWTIAAGAAHYISYLAIRGGLWEVVNSSAKTSTGSQSITNTIGFTPVGCIVWGCGDSSSTAQANLSFGCVSGTSNEGAMSWFDNDGLGTSRARRHITTDSTFIAISDAGNLGEFDLTSFDSSGVTWNWSTAGKAAGDYAALMIGEGVAQESAPRRSHVSFF